ncbi:unnamed protein product [Polarella glacialis]|uniref:Uncharacterized protein n=1 Tax=Polarella glacialis TaxID=89957 RepID=A0A813FNA8_POLGL|nr:unnamed protein product [Polarella glacialis]CAE8627734.1 unnamed protein product [Polarella glacialis]
MTSPRANSADGHKKAPMHPTLLGLSHIRRSPKWSFNSGREAAQTERRSADAPGPGTYGVQSPDVTSRYRRGPVISFGTAGRDVLTKTKVPGPGAYSAGKDAKDMGATGQSWTMSPRRNQSKSGTGETPGPGTHSLRTILGDGPKYTVSKRYDDPNKHLGPGPGEYHQAQQTSELPSWGFGKSNRPDTVGAAHLATPGPGAYMVGSTVGNGPRVTMKGRHPGPRPQQMPGPGAHGGHYSSFG